MNQQSKSLGRDWLESQSKKYIEIVSTMKSFFVVIDNSEDVLYLKCRDKAEAVSEVKRYLGVVTLDNTIEIIY